MSARYSVTPEDEFFQSLNESLQTEYDSHMMSYFISDLIAAINTLEYNADDGFLSDTDEDFCFTPPFSKTHTFSESSERDKPSAEASTNSQNLSVADIFADFQNDQEAIRMDLNCPEKEIILELQSDVDSLGNNSCCSDIFAEFEDEVEIMDSDVDSPNSVSEHVNDVQLRENGVRDTQNAEETTSATKSSNISAPRIDQEAEEPCDEVMKEDTVRNKSSAPGAPATYVARIEYPRTINYEIETPQIEHPACQAVFTESTVSETQEQGYSTSDTSFRGFLPVEISPQSYFRSTEHTDPNLTFCEEFYTFHSAPPGRDIDINTTFCEEYEATNNFSPVMLTAVSNARRGRDSDVNTTFCEEYESVNNFFPDGNSTQATNFNFEEVYLQCCLEGQNANRNTNSSQNIRGQYFITEIEKLVLRLQNDLKRGVKLTITVPYRISWDNCMFIDKRVKLQPLSDGRTRTIQSRSRIAMILYVASFVYTLLINNTTCTKREIYYSDPSFLQSQAKVDSVVKDICLILDATPWEIGIFSCSKGLIAGSIKITFEDDKTLDVENVEGGVLLPQHTMNIKKVETLAKFVLLVEKHTIYEKLLTENFLTRLKPCILITGKGYPDTNTRYILKKIWDDCKCPIYALVDADPYGIEIMLSCRHGSLNMSYCDLAIPSINWIGVLPSEIKKYKLKSLQLTNEDCIRLDGKLYKKQKLKL
ncbi:Meiotic recombination protein SPO11 [Pseudolycoriella hygida]|uniref:DNA topoisomerase (ATP-hydrolyzing) n=1 Tax=Pseudolycoriella hygida TaxID=35572 RepID=A0A9Q0MIY1_9DIPT|nr:Meiotic recombination protein SPO11 [Pseudolycoriella hygida]